jgi:hypothetical protein
MHKQTTRPGRSRSLGGRRGQGQAGQAETGSRGWGDRPQNAPTARSKSRRGIGPAGEGLWPAKVRVMMVARVLMRGAALRQQRRERHHRTPVKKKGRPKPPPNVPAPPIEARGAPRPRTSPSPARSCRHGQGRWCSWAAWSHAAALELVVVLVGRDVRAALRTHVVVRAHRAGGMRVLADKDLHPDQSVLERGSLPGCSRPLPRHRFWRPRRRPSDRSGEHKDLEALCGHGIEVEFLVSFVL